MKKIINGYYYLFYKIYKVSEAAPSRWMSEWKASLVIDVLELFLVTSVIYYFDINLGNGTAFYVFFILIISIPNYFVFNHNDNWRSYEIEFDKLPKKDNKINGIVVWFIIISIIVNLLFSVYIMDLRARKNQIGPYSKEYIDK